MNAETLLRSKLNTELAMKNNSDFTFNKILEAMEEYASLRVAEANTWVKLEDRLPEPKQRVDLWLVPDDEEKSHRITWTWEKEHTSNLRINASKATHWTPLQTPPTE